MSEAAAVPKNVIQLSEHLQTHKKRPVKKIKKYPLEKGTLRPFRLWLPHERAKNGDRGRQMSSKNYAYSWSAIEGAWMEVKWLKANQAVEVFNITNQRHIATFAKDRGGHYTEYVHKDFNIRINRRTKKPFKHKKA